MSKSWVALTSNHSCIDNITDSKDMSLSKLQELVKDRKVSVLQSMASQTVGHDLATKQQRMKFQWIVVKKKNMRIRKLKQWFWIFLYKIQEFLLSCENEKIYRILGFRSFNCLYLYFFYLINHHLFLAGWKNLRERDNELGLLSLIKNVRDDIQNWEFREYQEM